MRRFTFLYYIISLFSIILIGCEKTTNIEQAHEEVVMRKIGHEILLLSNDSTSLVLPIVNESNQYRIQFQSEFEFQPDTLVNTIDNIIKSELTNSHYIVKVESCESKEVVYSYEMDNSMFSDDIQESPQLPSELVPCRTRDQPKACYEIVLQLTQNNIQNHTWIYVLVAITIAIFILYKLISKATKREHLSKIGVYQFDSKNMKLLYKKEQIELTSKESELLQLLLQTPNETINRDTILNKVWGDEGDYVGRTLDVFISKLRKKLEQDSSIELKNIRGVGYRLIIGD